MSVPRAPEPAKLFVGIFLKDKTRSISVANALMELFGPFDTVSRWFPFDLTTYYKDEMGAPLFRRMFSFQRLINRSTLSEIKHQTIELEKQYARNGKRLVNIDPGYLSREHVALATGKNFSHRIYIGGGIFVDLTLIYLKGSFQKLPWTYPDYYQKSMMDYLKKVRQKYVNDLKGKSRIKTKN
jgi:hypothetical protein